MRNTCDSTKTATTVQTQKRLRIKRFVVRVMLIFGGLIVGLLAAECILRAVGFHEPQFYIPDRYIGTRLKPGFTGIWTKEGRASVQINSAGFRDREHSRNKPIGRYRIAVLGDSYIEALQVPLEETFCAVLETGLAECAMLRRRNVEVLSFGVSGFGTGQQLLMLRHYVWDYDPDMVILVMCPHNDITDNSRQLSSNVVRPFFTLKGERLVPDNSFRQHPSYIHAKRESTQRKVAWINRSRVLQLYCRIRNNIGHKRSGDTKISTDRNDLDNICYFEPEKPSWRSAWKLTERLVVQIHNEVRQQNVSFCLVIGTNAIQVDPRRSVRTEFRKELGVANLFYFERRMQELARRNRIPVICLGESLLRHARQHNRFLHGFSNTVLGQGHWNSEGHRVAAKLVVKKLCSDLQRKD